MALVGFPERADDVYNAAAVLADGRVAAVYRKMYLPNYGVFDEQRYFQAGTEPALFELNGVPIGRHGLRGHLGAGPAGHDRGAGRRAGAREPVGVARTSAGKALERERMLVQRARDNQAAVVF